MDLFSHVWQIYLYQPLVNMLVYLYNTVAGQNLGWAVVSLTICLRILLLPLSVMSERNEIIAEEMDDEVKEIERRYRADPVQLKENIRALMKKHHIRPWAKTIALAIQLLVLVLLYQVFLAGITGSQLIKILYASVDYPGRLNSVFFTMPVGSETVVFNIGERSLFWAGLVGVVLVVDIIIKLQRSTRKLDGSDLAYLILFPVFSFLVLWYLPMVKALFIITSMSFSYLLTLVRKLFWGKADAHGAHH
ncbi:MAG: YidC/Oxa1 family rane protein insertase [Patescibacteria group bacterium]|jgi:YidC/Oxa1 family membrane protein insertase|nr:YidC/Oxa1 family rane protein insertase [Patescibacteria group bacterium]